jgi:hypothetical protein
VNRIFNQLHSNLGIGVFRYFDGKFIEDVPLQIPKDKDRILIVQFDCDDVFMVLIEAEKPGLASSAFRNLSLSAFLHDSDGEQIPKLSAIAGLLSKRSLESSVLEVRLFSKIASRIILWFIAFSVVLLTEREVAIFASVGGCFSVSGTASFNPFIFNLLSERYL